MPHTGALSDPPPHGPAPHARLTMSPAAPSTHRMPPRPAGHTRRLPPEADHVDRALVWLRRDLRLDDHAALYHALKTARQVWCVFVFDRAILDALPRADRRVEFIHQSLVELDAALRARGGGLLVRLCFPASRCQHQA